MSSESVLLGTKLYNGLGDISQLTPTPTGHQSPSQAEEEEDGVYEEDPSDPRLLADKAKKTSSEVVPATVPPKAKGGHGSKKRVAVITSDNSDEEPVAGPSAGKKGKAKGKAGPSVKHRERDAIDDYVEQPPRLEEDMPPKRGPKATPKAKKLPMSAEEVLPRDGKMKGGRQMRGKGGKGAKSDAK